MDSRHGEVLLGSPRIAGRTVPAGEQLLIKKRESFESTYFLVLADLSGAGASAFTVRAIFDRGGRRFVALSYPAHIADEALGEPVVVLRIVNQALAETVDACELESLKSDYEKGRSTLSALSRCQVESLLGEFESCPEGG